MVTWICSIAVADISSLKVLRMNFRFAAIYILFIFGASRGAEAQLFTWGTPKPAPAVQSRAPAHSSFFRWNPFGFSSNRVSRPQAATAPDEASDGAYRTLCVRLCDGYYFPISYRTTRSKMYRESKICEASCDCETRLYYLPSASSDIEHMTDLSGLSYKHLETAFRYRSEWDQGCSCRPAPWALAEAARHNEYALAQEERLARGTGTKVANAAPGEPAPSKTVAATLVEQESVIAAAPENKLEPLGPSIGSILSVVAVPDAAPGRAAPGDVGHNLTPGTFAVLPEAGIQLTEAPAGADSNPPKERSVRSSRKTARLHQRPKAEAGRGLFQF